MIIDGNSYTKIMRELDLSERTLYRYLDIIFAEEQEFLREEVSAEELRRQFRIARDRLLDNLQEIKQWLKDDPKSKDRAALMNLASEISAAIVRIYNDGPGVLSEHHTFRNNNNNRLVGKGSTGIRLVLDREEEEEQEEEEEEEEQKAKVTFFEDGNGVISE